MSPVFLILITTSLYLFHFASAGPYAGSTLSVLVPFEEAQSMTTPFSSVYHVPIQLSDGLPGSAINTKVYHPFVDTGSTGIILPAASIPGFTIPTGPDAERGWQYLTSSKILYAGWWIEKDVYFNVNDPAHSVVKSTLKILAVTEKTEHCDDWEKNGDKDTCTGKSPAMCPTACPTGFGILGIGFARRALDQPQAFPERNPTLMVSTIGGIAATWPNFHRGYQIDRYGITLGLTDLNMGPFTNDEKPHAQLENPSSGSGLPDWNGLPSCVSVDASPCVPMPVLLDTGITTSYLHMPYSYFMDGSTRVDWDFDGIIHKTPITTGSTTYTLDAHSHVHIDFWPPPPAGNKNEDFDVGDAATIATGVTPDMVYFYVNNNANSFRVNTGMHIYRKYKIAFDSVWGWFWFAAV
ncbi:hypothetical protein B0O99DRAFT_629522 [Bisporella sp. PMI_857]|nr:hypothetical protein B0O99DRAFT_629522 [Bisporella sp. PMI_857]